MNIESVQTVTISIQQCVGIIACSVIITALATVLCMLYIPYQTIFSKVDFYVKEYSLNILFFFAKLGVIDDLNTCSFTRPNIDHDGNCLKSSREQQPIPGLDNENRDYLETRQETNETMNSSKDDIRKLNAKLPPNMTIPKHIGVIMDGNRRFGRKQYNNSMQGHWTGGQTLVNFLEWCIEYGIIECTVYAFSTENWKRDVTEVNTLMAIFTKYAAEFKVEALKRNVCVHILSTDFSKLPASVQEAVADLELATKQCDAFHFNICLSYGSRAEIVNACNHIVNDVVSVIRQEDSEQTGKMSELKKQESDSTNLTRTIPHITEDIFERYLASNEHHMTSNEQNKLFSNPDSYCISDPDLLIRTSGEFRISNFLLWQLAYTELFFIPQLWPEITQYDLRSILIQYNDRQRRYGK